MLHQNSDKQKNMLKTCRSSLTITKAFGNGWCKHEWAGWRCCCWRIVRNNKTALLLLLYNSAIQCCILEWLLRIHCAIDRVIKTAYICCSSWIALRKKRKRCKSHGMTMSASMRIVELWLWLFEHRCMYQFQSTCLLSNMLNHIPPYREYSFWQVQISMSSN